MRCILTVLIGNLIKVQAMFQDEHFEKQDPAIVQVRIKNPTGMIETYIYGINPELIRTSKGIYYVEIDTTGNPGTFQFVWNSNGTYQAAGQTEFTVKNTLF